MFKPQPITLANPTPAEHALQNAVLGYQAEQMRACNWQTLSADEQQAAREQIGTNILAISSLALSATENAIAIMAASPPTQQLAHSARNGALDAGADPITGTTRKGTSTGTKGGAGLAAASRKRGNAAAAQASA